MVDYNTRVCCHCRLLGQLMLVRTWVPDILKSSQQIFFLGMNKEVFEMIFKDIKAKALRMHTWKGTKKTKIPRTHSKYIKVEI